jgi:hypothetical protein
MKLILEDNGLKYVELEILGNWFANGASKVRSDRINKICSKPPQSWEHGPPEILAKLGQEVLDPKSYYMRIRPNFETADPRYAWLNNTVSIGYGDRRPEGPIYHLYEIFEQ